MKKNNDENYRFLIDTEWRNIHHSRTQEWTALGAISGTHVGIISLINIYKDLPEAFSFNVIVSFSTITGIILSIIGILITMRHRQLMIIKLGWIYQAELKLGLIKENEESEGIIPKHELV